MTLREAARAVVRAIHEEAQRFALAAWALLVIAVFVGFWAIVGARQLAVDKFKQTDVRLCEKFSKPIRGSLQRSLKTLPTLAYYKQHPDELRSAQTENRRLLREMSAKECEQLSSQQAK